MLKVYSYKNCGTCKKAIKFLDDKGIDYKLLAIRETPPTKAELKKMLNFMDGNLKKMFNTSGQDYRAMGMKDKLPNLTETKAIDLLSKHGNLIKRPFAISAKIGLVGFKPDLWSASL